MHHPFTANAQAPYTRSMQVLWNPPERSTWDALHRSASGALQQHWSYGAALHAGAARCMRALVTADGAPVAIAQFMCRRIGFLVEVALCTRGPVWLTPLDAVGRARAYRALKKTFPARLPRVVMFSPDEPAADGAPGAGLHRVMTGYSTVQIDLTRAPDELRADLAGNWRNRLVAAERSALKVQRGGTKPAQYRWLLEREATQRDRKTYRGLPLEFVEAYQAACTDPAAALLHLRADLGRDAQAGMLFLVHGDAATYHVGWSSEEGRKLGAHSLLLWHAINVLRERGLRRLDLGGVDTERGAGIARFKIGTGGAVVTLAGTYW